MCVGHFTGVSFENRREQSLLFKNIVTLFHPCEIVNDFWYLNSDLNMFYYFLKIKCLQDTTYILRNRCRYLGT